MVSVDVPSSIGFHVNIRDLGTGVEGNLLAERHDDGERYGIGESGIGIPRRMRRREDE